MHPSYEYLLQVRQSLGVESHASWIMATVTAGSCRIDLIFQHPEVLMMVEATSAIDNKTGEAVMQAIQNLKENRTLIMIAHRLNTVENCEGLYYLADGRILASGSYQKLIDLSPGFRDLMLENPRSP